jgi:hypothetical protein
MWPFSRRAPKSESAGKNAGVGEETAFWRTFFGEIITSIAVLVPIWLVADALAVDKADIEFMGRSSIHRLVKL